MSREVHSHPWSGATLSSAVIQTKIETKRADVEGYACSVVCARKDSSMPGCRVKHRL